jgi:hypothetical protein
MPLVRRFAFPTTGCFESEGVHNPGAVAAPLCGGLPSSLFGPASTTRGACPPCHRADLLVHTRRLCPWRSGRKRGTSSFKKGSTPRVEVMPCSSCILRALPPSGPLDGVCRCLLEGDASKPSPPVVLSSESLRPQLGCRSCLPFAVIRGVQPREGRCSSVTTRLQGFSSCSLAAVPRLWPSRRMTTSLTVGRSKLGCDFPPPSLSFKDVHHPRRGGGRAKSGPYPPRGLATRFFLHHLEEKGVCQPCGGGGPRLRGAGWPWAVSCSVPGPLG